MGFVESCADGVVIKAIRGGYDGRGVWLPDSLDEALDVLADATAAGTPVMAEERVPWRRELSAMVARSAYGQGATWPVVETVQRDGQCAVAIAPAPGLSDERAEEAEHIALQIAQTLGVVGVMAVEMFETDDGALSINELAMRPTTAATGPWTVPSPASSSSTCAPSSGLPARCDPRAAPVTVMANVLGAPETPAMSMDERVTT